jgi:hypothetical protein
MREGNAEDFIDFLIATRNDFILQCSNYTISIDSSDFKKKFVTTMQAPRTFGAFAKLKKDLKIKPVPEVDKTKLRYYVHNFTRDCNYPVIFNVDLKSAYATILKNDGLISEDTFMYLSRLDKKQRLASVGMLASHRDIFHFKSGKINKTDEYNSEFSNFFFHLVKRTSEIMDELKLICGNNFLFTWVDGIYFMPDESIMSECAQYLESIKFPHSMDVLTDFSVKILRTHTRVYLRKEGKLKPFNLPHQDSGMKQILKSVIIQNSKPIEKVFINSKPKTKHNEASKKMGKRERSK